MWLERLDPHDWNRWVDDSRGLAAYVFRGELRSEEITEDDARWIIEDRGAINDRGKGSIVFNHPFDEILEITKQRSKLRSAE